VQRERETQCRERLDAGADRRVAGAVGAAILGGADEVKGVGDAPPGPSLDDARVRAELDLRLQVVGRVAQVHDAVHGVPPVERVVLPLLVLHVSAVVQHIGLEFEIGELHLLADILTVEGQQQLRVSRRLVMRGADGEGLRAGPASTPAART
jgi:hypothetical protein